MKQGHTAEEGDDAPTNPVLGMSVWDDADADEIRHAPVTALSFPHGRAAPPSGVTSPTTRVTTPFGPFYARSAPRLVAFLRWQGASFPDAAECAQEALTQ